MGLVDLSVAERLAELPSIAVAVSGGKDATAVLDLVRRYSTARVSAFFMYMVEGLEFQERYLRYLERRFEVDIVRVPHFFNSTYLETGAYAVPTKAEAVRQADVFAYIREQTRCEWIALGEKKCDSPPRLWSLRKCRCHDEAGRKTYPVGNWTHGQVFSYLKQRCIAMPPEYRFGMSTSFGGFIAEELRAIKSRYPHDFEKIKRRFPFIEAAIVRADIVKASGVRGSDYQSSADQKCGLQSAIDRQVCKEQAKGIAEEGGAG